MHARTHARTHARLLLISRVARFSRRDARRGNAARSVDVRLIVDVLVSRFSIESPRVTLERFRVVSFFSFLFFLPFFSLPRSGAPCDLSASFAAGRNACIVVSAHALTREGNVTARRDVVIESAPAR